MIPFKNAGWVWYNHFQDIWPSARARGAHAFVGGHDAAPATAVNLPSTPTSAPALLSTIMPSDAEMDETDPTMSVLSAKHKNEASDFERLRISGSSPQASTTLIASDASHSHKATKIHLTSSALSSLTGASNCASSTTDSSHATLSQMLPSKKLARRPVKCSHTDALAEELQGAIATLADTLRVTAEDPVTTTLCTATKMVNADTTLNNRKRLHIIQRFINNVAYAEIYIAMLDKPSLKKKFYVKMLKNYAIDSDEEEEEEDNDSHF